MATLGNALVTKILGHSEAEKAFRPWWDNLEDFLVYGLVMLGLIVAPTAIINGTPLDCTLCKKTNCKYMNLTEDQRKQSDPEYNAWWIKKYCTMTAVDGFVMYFPYILLVMALMMVLIERGFVRIFKAGLKLDAFYGFLVKENELPSKSHGDGDSDDEDGDGEKVLLDSMSSRRTFEISHSFSRSDNYFTSYLVRTGMEAAVATGLLIWLCGFGLPIIYHDEFIRCDIYGTIYECSGHPQEFYMYSLIVAIVILVLYLLCCIYNFFWLILPRMGNLSKVMTTYKDQMMRKAKEAGLKSGQPAPTEKEVMGALYKLYYNNRDLKLLLDLLASSSGIATSLKVLAIFDEQIRIKMQPKNVKLTFFNFRKPRDEEERNPLLMRYLSCTTVDGGDLQDVASKAKKKDKSKERMFYDVDVEFFEPVAVQEIFSHIKKVNCFYTVELYPYTIKSNIVTIEPDDGDYPQDEAGKVRSGASVLEVAVEEARGDAGHQQVSPNGSLNGLDGATVEMQPLEGGGANIGLYLDRSPLARVMRTTLFNLDTTKDYRVAVSTRMNGKAISRRVEKIKGKSDKEEDNKEDKKEG